MKNEKPEQPKKPRKKPEFKIDYDDPNAVKDAIRLILEGLPFIGRMYGFLALVKECGIKYTSAITEPFVTLGLIEQDTTGYRKTDKDHKDPLLVGQIYESFIFNKTPKEPEVPVILITPTDDPEFVSVSVRDLSALVSLYSGLNEKTNQILTMLEETGLFTKKDKAA